MLIITKVNRWQHLDSDRPQTLLRKAADEQDITAILNWLARHDETINFDDYGVKSKPELVALFRKRFVDCPGLRASLLEVLRPEDKAHVGVLDAGE